LALLRERLHPRSLRRRVVERRERLAHSSHRLVAAVRTAVAARRGEMKRLADVLASISPLAVLARGYAICQDSHEAVVRDHREVSAGDAVRVRLHRGSLDCEVLRACAPRAEDE
jgi:exodeoxyribonuclease VII large subunit